MVEKNDQNIHLTRSVCNYISLNYISVTIFAFVLYFSFLLLLFLINYLHNKFLMDKS